jgi:hypothetical protein
MVIPVETACPAGNPDECLGMPGGFTIAESAIISVMPANARIQHPFHYLSFTNKYLHCFSEVVRFTTINKN